MTSLITLQLLSKWQRHPAAEMSGWKPLPPCWPTLKCKLLLEHFEGGGYKDWRLPTTNELAGLYDSSINKGYKVSKLITFTGCCPWSSDTRDSEMATFRFYIGLRNWNRQYGAIDPQALCKHSCALGNRIWVDDPVPVDERGSPVRIKSNCSPETLMT